MFPEKLLISARFTFSESRLKACAYQAFSLSTAVYLMFLQLRLWVSQQRLFKRAEDDTRILTQENKR